MGGVFVILALSKWIGSVNTLEKMREWVLVYILEGFYYKSFRVCYVCKSCVPLSAVIISFREVAKPAVLVGSSVLLN